MYHVDAGSVSLACTVIGSGEPVMCIHGAFIAETFRPLLAEPALTERYQLITYHRRGYGSSTRAPESTSMPEQAADCRAVLRGLGIERAHVVGHSLGGCIALQFALDTPACVHSLALLEPALAVGDSAVSYRAALLDGRRRYHEIGATTAIDEFLTARWPGYRGKLHAVLPGGFDQAVADAETFYDVEVPSLLGWQFGENDARRINCPVLSVLGSESDALWPRFGETHRAVLTWWPDAEGYVLPRATHFLQVQNPRDMAEALAAFFARHPISVGS